MKKQNKIKQDKCTKIDIFALLPILFALCIIPFIVLTKDYQTNFSDFIWFNTNELDQIDSFEYTKGVFVIATGIVSAILLIITQFLSYQKKKTFLQVADKRILILTGVFALMVVLSSITSKYPDLAFHGGGYGQWQSMWVLLGYSFIFLYTYMFADSDKRIRFIFVGLLISTALMTWIGVLQKMGHNPLNLDWVQKIVTSKSRVNGITFKQGYSQVIMTFNNPNYTGTYVALIFPVALSFVMTKFSKENTTNWIVRIASILISIGLIVALTGSGSSAGGIAVVAGVIFAALLLLTSLFRRKKVVEPTASKSKKVQAAKKKKQIIIACTSAAVVVLLVIGGFSASKSTFVQNTVNKLLHGGTDTRNVASIVNQENNHLKITMRSGEVMNLIADRNAQGAIFYTAYDEDEKEVVMKWTLDKASYIPQDERFSALHISSSKFRVGEDVHEGFRLQDAANDITWIFMLIDGEWKYYTPFGKFMKLREVESFGFEDYQNIANRRGFIWSRTIPLMKKYWFTGVGPNAFIIAFPNDDFVGSKRVGNNTTLVDKPHNAFLQIFIQTGGISAVAYVGLWILYVCGSIRLYWRRRPDGTLEWLNFGVLTGMVCFAITGITNDTVIGVQNIYWILLALGHALNRSIKTARNN
nr:O-antigen ligase family protein [Eubacterium sp.]